MTLDMIKEEIRTLSVEQRKQLIAYIVDSLTETSSEELHDALEFGNKFYFRFWQNASSSEKLHDALEFEGVGAHLRDDSIDAQEYVNQLRSEWDHRP